MTTQFRFNCTEKSKRKCELALELSRAINSDKEEFERREWRQHAFLDVMQTYIDNADEEVFTCLKTQQRTVRGKRREAELAGEPFTPKDASRIRERIRRNFAERYNGGGKKTAKSTDDRGRLYEACLVSGARFLASCLRDGEERDSFTFFENDSLNKFIQKWERDGGYLIKIMGDPRACGEDGGRSVVYLWMESDIEFRIREEYAHLLQELDEPEIDIFEIVPASGSDWESPQITNGTLALKGK